MLSAELNEVVTRIGPGTPMGTVFRRYWLPALLSSEVPDPDGPPVRGSRMRDDAPSRGRRHCGWSRAGGRSGGVVA